MPAETCKTTVVKTANNESWINVTDSILVKEQTNSSVDCGDQGCAKFQRGQQKGKVTNSWG